MVELFAADYLWIGSALRHLAMEMEVEQNHMPDMPPSYAESVANHLAAVSARCQILELQVAKAIVEHWEKDFRSTSHTFVEGRLAIEEIERVIRCEGATTKFFYVSRERSSEFMKMLAEVRELWTRPWPIAFINLDHARECYLVEQFTASVFHSMRAAEKVLIALAAELKVNSKRESWQVLIEGIESEIKELDKLAKGDEREKKQAFYSEVAMQLRYIKNAWRNHVMHARSVYGEKEAREIWWHIKGLVSVASKELQEEVELEERYTHGHRVTVCWIGPPLDSMLQ